MFWNTAEMSSIQIKDASRLIRLSIIQIICRVNIVVSIGAVLVLFCSFLYSGGYFHRFIFNGTLDQFQSVLIFSNNFSNVFEKVATKLEKRIFKKGGKVLRRSGHRATRRRRLVKGEEVGGRCASAAAACFGDLLCGWKLHNPVISDEEQSRWLIELLVRDGKLD